MNDFKESPDGSHAVAIYGWYPVRDLIYGFADSGLLVYSGSLRSRVYKTTDLGRQRLKELKELEAL